MPGRHKNRDEYTPLFDRIERAFNPEDMTPGRLKEYLNASTEGMESLAEQLSQTYLISKELEKAETLDELKSLEEQAKGLEVHGSTVLERIIEKEVAISFALGEEFAEEKGVKLSERTIAGVETWRGKQVLTIRKDGKFISWKKL